jgi:hypothetical protein
MNGTWKTTGGSGGGTALVAIIGVALLIGSGVLTAAVAAVTELLVIVLVCAVAAVVIVTIAGVLIWRKYGHRTAPALEQYAAFHAARETERLRAVPQRQQIAADRVLHLHYHAAPGQAAEPDWQAAVLKAIPERGQQR